jgi:hypothetical protein
MNRKFTFTTAIALLLVSEMALAGLAAAAPTDPVPPAPAAITPAPLPGMQLLGHVVWEGRAEQPDALQIMPITVHLRQVDTDPGYETELEAVTDEKGYLLLQLGPLSPGLYEWRAKGAQYLSNSGLVTIGQSQITTVDMGLMRPGDINKDNVVSARDFSALTGSFGKKAGDTGYVAEADFTGDDAVTIRDFTLLASHYGQAGN